MIKNLQINKDVANNVNLEKDSLNLFKQPDKTESNWLILEKF